ncbi:MAG: hypothetical protein LBC59_08055 [Chitinispirillales bacterium]|jgi:uncharacterized protein (TIGR02145 family)|nr:hypothetical protein [Chitinispirillales bacterium]
MNFFTFTKLKRTLLMLTAVFWLGCGGDGNPSNNNNGGGTDSTGNNTTHTHTWGEWSITTAPTCTASGVETRSCTQGDTTETREIPQLTGAACYYGGAPNICGKDGTADSCKKTEIGGVTWLAENLNYLLESGNSWCYDNDETNCDIYGRLYDWETAKTVCPTGWRLPDTADWNRLDEATGGGGSRNEKLKSTSGWKNSYGESANGTDDFGFSALPGGVFTYAFTDGPFFQMKGSQGYWWTITERSDGRGDSRYIVAIGLIIGGGISDDGLSVRCIADN